MPLHRPTPARRFGAPAFNSYARSASQPLSEMNTTPLIDVLLVLLVMLIMAVPLGTHQTSVDLPPPNGEGMMHREPVALTVDASGQSYWNGSAVDAARLAQRLRAAAASNPQPVIRFQPDPAASYDASVKVIAMAGDAGIENLTFIGNERFREFGR